MGLSIDRKMAGERAIDPNNKINWKKKKKMEFNL